jgi:hypothetical protein
MNEESLSVQAINHNLEDIALLVEEIHQLRPELSIERIGYLIQMLAMASNDVPQRCAEFLYAFFLVCPQLS